MSSLDRILPFLRPIEDLLLDPTVTEVMVNDGGRRVFVERDGTIESVPARKLETRNLTVAIKNIPRAAGTAPRRFGRWRYFPALLGSWSCPDDSEIHQTLHGQPRDGCGLDRAV